jgi:RHS repeat-associated protein
VKFIQQLTSRPSDPVLENTQGSYYRARYYDPLAGRFLSEDPFGFKADPNFYRYVKNDSTNLSDPTGLYTLEGIPPAQAAEMTIAIGQLWAKLRSEPCCAGAQGPKLIGLLQPGNYGDGVTFVYNKTLPSPPGQTNCGMVGSGSGHPVGNFWRYVTNRVDISEDAFSNRNCPFLADLILHEIVHLTKANRESPDPEADARNFEIKCFGLASMGK